MAIETSGTFTIKTAQRLADCLARIESRRDGVKYTMTVTRIDKSKEKSPGSAKPRRLEKN